MASPLVGSLGPGVARGQAGGDEPDPDRATGRGAGVRTRPDLPVRGRPYRYEPYAGIFAAPKGTVRPRRQLPGPVSAARRTPGSVLDAGAVRDRRRSTPRPRRPSHQPLSSTRTQPGRNSSRRSGGPCRARSLPSSPPIDPETLTRLQAGAAAAGRVIGWARDELRATTDTLAQAPRMQASHSRLHPWACPPRNVTGMPGCSGLRVRLDRPGPGPPGRRAWHAARVGCRPGRPAAGRATTHG